MRIPWKASIIELLALGLVPCLAGAAPRAVAPDLPPSLGAASPWPPPEAAVSWSSGTRPASTIELQLLAFNDFHGNLETPPVSTQRPAGGAAALAAYLEAAARVAPERTLIVHAGDLLGASPPLTRLLRNEPAIQFLDLLGNEHCAYGTATHFFDAASWQRHPDRCNVIGTLGNHEFDAGGAEVRRLLQGGNAHDGPFLEHPYRGSRVPYVCANVKDRRTGRLLLPPYAVVVLGGIPVGVIGAVVRETPTIVPAWAIADLEFMDEADSINRAAAELERHGIHTLIVTIHQGVVPVRTPAGWDWHGPLKKIVARLDPDIDVVVSGHTHQYTNALLPNRAGSPVLVTQAYAYGVAYAHIALQVDPRTRDVVQKSARIVPVWGDSGAALHPDASVVALTASAERAVAPRIARVIATAAAPITRGLTAAGESALGDLVADAQRDALHADLALMNPGGLRSDLRPGPITWGDILTLHPFGNRLLKLRLTGEQLLQVLEEQWPADPNAIPRILKTSGFSYVWDPYRPAGHHIVTACDARHHPLEPMQSYSVTVNDFLAAGGDGFVRLKDGQREQLGPLDAEALSLYLSHQPGAIEEHTDGRIALANGAAGSSCSAAAAVQDAQLR